MMVIFFCFRLLRLKRFFLPLSHKLYTNIHLELFAYYYSWLLSGGYTQGHNLLIDYNNYNNNIMNAFISFFSNVPLFIIYAFCD